MNPALRTMHERAGATLMIEPDNERVMHYGDIAAERQALRTGAGLVDLSDLVTVQVTGRDRIRFLNGMVTHELAKLEPGQGNYALLLNIQGKVVADLQVYVFPEHLLMVFPAPVHRAGMEMLDRYLIADKVKFADRSREVGWLSIQGPEAEGVVKRALELSPPGPLHAHIGITVGGLEGVLSREDRTGFGGFDLMLPQERLEQVWSALLEAGALPVGQTALDIVRVESGIPVTGRDLTGFNIPLEAGKAFEERAISFSKGCYIGQEVICRVKARGHVNWMLTGFRIDADVAPGTRLFSTEKDVGWVTSIVESPELGRIGLGYVHRNARQIGGKLRTGSSEGPLEVEMQDLPLLPPESRTPSV